jgi:hypothetical protein
MFDPLSDKLDVSDQHGGAGIHSFFMSDSHDAQPVVSGAFADSDPSSDTGGKDFATTTGNRMKPGGFEPTDDLTDVHSKKTFELDKLGW